MHLEVRTEDMDSAKAVIASLSRGCPRSCERAINEQLMKYALPPAKMLLSPELDLPGDRRTLGLEVTAKVEG